MDETTSAAPATPFPLLVVDHLREVDRRNKAIWAAANLDTFDALVEAVWRFENEGIEAFARGARLVRLEGVKTPVTGKIVQVPALTGKAAEYIAEYARPSELQVAA